MIYIHHGLAGEVIGDALADDLEETAYAFAALANRGVDANALADYINSDEDRKAVRRMCAEIVRELLEQGE
jgi:hypothetical protein